MNASMIDILVCPFDKQTLTLKIIAQDLEGSIIEGLFTCSHCKRYYPIVQGIPIMSPDEYREAALEAPILKRWEDHLEGHVVNNFRMEGSSSRKQLDKSL